MKPKSLTVRLAILFFLGAACAAPNVWALSAEASTAPAPGPAPKGDKSGDPKDEKKPPRKLDAPAKLIEKLENGDFEERQQAAEDLKEHGEAAREVLEKAAKESEDLEVKETSARLLALLARSTLKLELMDRRGNSMPGIEGDINCYNYGNLPVFVNPAQQRQQKSVTSGADGAVEVEGLRPGPLQVNVNWKNAFLVPNLRPFYNITLRKGENRMQYVMTKGGKVKLSVVNAETGKPVEGASVSLVVDQGFDYGNLDMDMLLQQNGWMATNFTGTTDAKGVATVEKVGQGSYVAIVRQDDCLPGVVREVLVRDGQETVIEAPVKLVGKAAALGTIKVRLMDGDKPLKKGKAIVEAQRNNAEKESANPNPMWQMRWQWGMQQEQVEQEADDDGFIELKDKRPGTYRITVVRQGLTPAVVKDVAVEAGKTVKVDVAKPGPGAKIAGKILNGAGKGVANAQVLAIPLEEMAEMSKSGEGLAQFQNMFWYRRQRFGGRNTDYAASNSEGRYEIKGLAPGDYAMVAMLPQGRLALVWGVKAEEGKTAEAPEVKLPETDKSAGGQTAATVKLNGIVLMPDGKPAEQGQITLHYRYMSGMGSGSWGAGIAKDGKFNFSRTWNNDDMRDMEPFRLTLQMPGCKPKTVDLTKEGLNLENLEVRLEKQTFGQARFLVADLEGRPLRGARITPAVNSYRQRYYGQRTPPRSKSTNEKGEAYFTGLASGKRTFAVELDGYFLDEPAEVVVPADGEAQLTLKLRPTLQIKGKVVLPAGFEASKVVLCLQALENDYQTVRTAGLDAEGRFTFDGLPPGKYQVFSNHPKLALATQGVVELSDKNAETELKLAPAGGVKLEFGAENKRANVWLSEPGRWDPGAKKEPQNIYGGPAWSNADAAGRAEIFGLQPGTYDLVATPATPQASYQQHRSRARLVVKDIQVPALPGGYDDLEKAAGVPVKLPEAGSSLRGVLTKKGEWKALENNNISIGSLQVHVVGAQAVASVAFNLPQDFMSNREPVIVGQPPANFQSAKPNEFSVDGLPPGEYRIYTELTTYNRAGRRGRLLGMQAGVGGRDAAKGKKEEPAPKLVKTVTIEAGKALEAVEVEFEISAEVKEKVAEEMEKQFEMNYGGETGEDEPEVAKP